VGSTRGHFSGCSQERGIRSKFVFISDSSSSHLVLNTAHVKGPWRPLGSLSQVPLLRPTRSLSATSANLSRPTMLLSGKILYKAMKWKERGYRPTVRGRKHFSMRRRCHDIYLLHIQCSFWRAEVIERNPSSYLRYKLKHAALHGAQRYDEAIEAFQIMLYKLDNTSDAQARSESRHYTCLTLLRAAPAVSEPIRWRVHYSRDHSCSNGEYPASFTRCRDWASM
jgi:hypothetical protein